MSKNISYFSKIKIALFYVIVSVFLSSCFKTINIVQLNKVEHKKVINKKHVNKKRHTAVQIDNDDIIYHNLNKIEDVSNIINYQDNNYSNIDDNFFETYQENEDDLCEQGENCKNEETTTNQDNQNDMTDNEVLNNDNSNDNKDTIKQMQKQFKVNFPALKKKLKIKERDRNICHINERLSITPKLVIITNKKRNYLLNFSYKF